ncbi:MAG: hypothetical protein R3C01_10390 [Planctomycetaceae bacterium]
MTPAENPLPIHSRGPNRMVLLGVLLFGLAIWGHFYNQFWYGPDEGNYAHVAQRLLDGERLHRDVHDIHLGAINFTNAAALWLFGDDLVSLRYPLAAIGVLQGLLTAWLFLPLGRREAALAGCLAVSLGAIQFLNPTAHWYALFFSLLLIAALDRARRQSLANGHTPFMTLLTIGLLIGVITQYRQLNGVFMAMATLVCLLGRIGRVATDLSQPDVDRCKADTITQRADFRSTLVSRTVLLIATVGLAGYLKTRWDGLITPLFGLCPLVILILATWKTEAGNRAALRTIWPIVLGGVVSLMPVVLYHLSHGTVVDWLDDTVVRAVRFGRSSFLDRTSFSKPLFDSLTILLLGPGIVPRLNAIFWITLLISPAVVGVAAVRDCWRLVQPVPDSQSAAAVVPGTTSQETRVFDTNGESVRMIWLTVAPFAALVALHYQILIYLLYTCAIIVPGWLLLRGKVVSPSRRPTMVEYLGVFLCVIALFFQAGQPLERGTHGILTGVRRNMVPSEGVPRVSLEGTFDQVVLYRQLTKVIEQQTKLGDPILAIPSNAELYFISGRRNPTGYFNLALWIQDDAAVSRLIDDLQQDIPKLVIYDDEDKYNSEFTKKLFENLTVKGTQLPRIGRFQIYRMP